MTNTTPTQRRAAGATPSRYYWTHDALPRYAAFDSPDRAPDIVAMTRAHVREQTLRATRATRAANRRRVLRGDDDDAPLLGLY